MDIRRVMPCSVTQLCTIKLSLNIDILCNVIKFLNEKVSAFEYEGNVNVN